MGLKGYRLWFMGQLDSACRAPPRRSLGCHRKRDGRETSGPPPPLAQRQRRQQQQQEQQRQQQHRRRRRGSASFRRRRRAVGAPRRGSPAGTGSRARCPRRQPPTSRRTQPAGCTSRPPRTPPCRGTSCIRKQRFETSRSLNKFQGWEPGAFKECWINCIQLVQPHRGRAQQNARVGLRGEHRRRRRHHRHRLARARRAQHAVRRAQRRAPRDEGGYSRGGVKFVTWAILAVVS
jgi:hypothetical protein